MELAKKGIYKIISRKMKELREYYKLSQQEFGEKIGTSGQNIYRYENGVVNLPVDVLLNIMGNFNVPLEYFTNEGVNPGEIDLKKRISTEYSSPIVITSEEEKNYIDRRKFTAVPVIESYEVRKADETATCIKSEVKD
jgi:transcriptional regulator with XRE-family HTH domain